jgi:hypothetical protein
VVLPSESIIDLVDSDFQMTHFGIIYLSSSYLSQMNSNDQLTKVQNKLKLLNMIAKQLAKHWSFDSFEVNCEKSYIQSNFESSNSNAETSDEYDIVTETTSMVKSYCESNNCVVSDSGENYNRTNQRDYIDRSLNSYLELNEKCFLYKGFINWLSYLAFQTVQPDLFDLVSFSRLLNKKVKNTANLDLIQVQLEWSLIKEVDETYFLANQNLNHIYQSYEFPRLVGNNNFQKIKTEMKVNTIINVIDYI